MESVSHFKSFKIDSISAQISRNVNEALESRYQREIKRILYGNDKQADLTISQHRLCRLNAHAHVVGQLQSLLTIAVMELKHLETVNNQHAPIPSK